MLIAFTLTMPGAASWNGKWSGEGELYARVRRFSKKSEDLANEILTTGYFLYSFGDGWRAGITVTKVDAKEAARIRKKSKGFCGYEWIIDSIVENNCIKKGEP